MKQCKTEKLRFSFDSALYTVLELNRQHDRFKYSNDVVGTKNWLQLNSINCRTPYARLFMPSGNLEEPNHAETSLDMRDKTSDHGENQHEHKEHMTKGTRDQTLDPRTVRNQHYSWKLGNIHFIFCGSALSSTIGQD